MPESVALLRQYAEKGTEEAFAELVRRHIDFVYTLALRQLNGDAHLARDVAQRVFADLARKAAELSCRPTLSGWLYRSTQFAAATAVRTEQRRRAREQEAHLMNELQSGGPSRDPWSAVRPELDRVMGRLSDGDRDAVLLRFFEGQPFAEIGRRLRLSENAAQMRVERALEKLRLLLARRGLHSTPTALSAMLAEQPSGTAPSDMAAAVTGWAMAAAAGGGRFTLFHFMSSIKLQASLAAVCVAAGLTTIFQQRESIRQTEEEIANYRRGAGGDGLTRGLSQIVSLRAENQALARAVAEAGDLAAANAQMAGIRSSAAAVSQKIRDRAGNSNPATGRWGAEVFESALLEQPPVATWQTRPVYPADMALTGSSGQVLVDYVVQPDGTTGQISATSSSDLSFAKAAIAAIQQWKFTPGQLGGQPVGTHLQTPVIFGISDDSGGTVPGFFVARTRPAPTSWF